MTEILRSVATGRTAATDRERFQAFAARPVFSEERLPMDEVQAAYLTDRVSWSQAVDNIFESEDEDRSFESLLASETDLEKGLKTPLGRR